ncbi:MAG: tetratricopeptide repeat protein [Pirellulales bacterium]
MSGSRWIDSLWPGLPTLWRGDLSGFAPAAAFAALLNAALVSTFIWTEMAGTGVRWGAWSVVALSMLASVWATRRSARKPRPQDFAGQGDLFPAAINEYLQGNWVLAEQQLQKMLAAWPEDLEARLMLATVWRRTGRREDAQKGLSALCQLDGAVKWSREIRIEMRLLEQADEEEAASSSHVSAEDDESPPLRQAA